MVPFDFGAVYSTIRYERPVAFIHAGYLRAGAFVACCRLRGGGNAPVPALPRPSHRTPPGSAAARGLPGVARTRDIARLAGTSADPVVGRHRDLLGVLLVSRVRADGATLADAGAVAAPDRELLPVSGTASDSVGQGRGQLANHRYRDRTGSRRDPAERAQAAGLGVHPAGRALDVSRDRLRQARRDTPCRMPSRPS